MNARVTDTSPARRLVVMRRFAGGLLAAMAALFVAARHFEGTAGGGDGPWTWLRVFSEAAMVGGLADWFAVTALFRRPLGLPIPHTAIIPANKNRIADTMAGFLRTHFLTVPVVARRLAGLNAGGTAERWLADPRLHVGTRLRRAGAALLAEVLTALDSQGQLGRLARSAVHRQLEQVELSPLLGQLLRATIAEGRHRPLIEAMLRGAGHALEDNEALLRAIIHARANAILRWTGLDERLANAVLDGFYRLLAECIVDPEHPLRLKLEEGLFRLADRLEHDPVMRAQVARAQRDLLANPALAAWFDRLWLRWRDHLLDAAAKPETMFADGLGRGFTELGATLARDPALRAQAGRVARRILVGIATRYGGAIVTLVSETVRRWDAGTVTARIEGAVGRDLQFIRINGTLVGGLVGVTIHSLDRLFTSFF